MWIKYSDSEVNKFHPVCEHALNQALNSLGLQRTYQVIHHQHTGTLEMDFVIQNKRTGKYMCVIEVKRTPTDVHSARYQYQAMSYVQMNEGQTEAPFYILTNLEYAFSFRYDPRRPRVFQQMLSPGLHSIGLFSDYQNEDEFTDVLATFFENRIVAFVSGNFSYLVTLDQFASHMEQVKTHPKRWKSHLAILLYEYIRGAFTVVARNDLHDVRLFNSDVIRICNEAAHINFQEIFGYSPDKYEDTAYVENNILVNLFDFAQQSVTGDSVADVLHQVVSNGHEHEGEVPTDLELARILCVLAHKNNGDLLPTDMVCDPAAGSGSLISSAISEFNLSANQIKANDINAQLGELLTLRLGLNYSRVVGNGYAPAVSCDDVCDLTPAYFEHVKIIVMNPPFLGGVYAAARKQPFYRKINRLAGRDTGTNIGQMPLEAAFLELMTYLVQPGTTIACIFPKTHLSARGPEAQAIRRLLLGRFGLSAVFSYPGNDIFVDVTKDTCILVGTVGRQYDTVKIISSYENIPNIDLARFAEAISQPLENDFAQIMPGIVGKKTFRNELLDSIETGWRGINSEMLEAIDFVDSVFSNQDTFRTINDCEWNMKRGGAANQGGSDILFFNSRPEMMRHFSNHNLGLKAGMRNAEADTFICNEGDSSFLDASAISEDLLDEIIEYYLSLPARDGQQARYNKTKEQWKAIINRESRGKFLPYTVLIPRALRRKGRVHYVENEIFVSTNFLVCYGMDRRNALLLATWVSTILFQLVCEVSSKDQEGLRKMEIADIKATFVPKFENVPEEILHELEQEASSLRFLDLQSPEIREVDMIWARYLFGEEAGSYVERARTLLSYLANRRNS